MGLPKRYDHKAVEHRLQAFWQESGTYHFHPDAKEPVFSIDTPPPTASGNLHLGHVYSYSHADLIARFWRMNGRNVFYPMGYDDNGLPTERLVERRLGITAGQVGRRAFIEKCLELGQEVEKEYEALWRRLGLSIDWRYTYRTIDELSRRTSQLSFLDLYHKGLAYRKESPAIWCPECKTAIAQAELNDLERKSEFVTLSFRLENGETLPIATTRPELLPACVAVFVHPNDGRFRRLVGQKVEVPLFGSKVPLLSDPAADPEKGTGAVMCCTFGDTTDIKWWHTHSLPLKEVIGRDNRMTELAGDFAGLTVSDAKRRIVEALKERGLILGREPLSQSVRVHERCDTPVEYIVTKQWFIRVLDFKKEFLEAGEKIAWHPAHMKARYRQWVEDLGWDWCISRQRYFGVHFPVWYCSSCGEVMVADEGQLPVDPNDQKPDKPCDCGSTSFSPEEDVMDTWATSSLTPQIIGRWLAGRDDTSDRLYERVFPMSLRPQAHEIIRTWAFYTIVKSHHHFGTLPWKEVAISGWGLAPEGTGKISKSRGGGPMGPAEVIEKHSADAVRYWAASTSLGKDSVISEEKIQMGAKLITKLWNIARFSQPFLKGYKTSVGALHAAPLLSPVDRWILSRTYRLVRRVTELFHDYDYATAKSEMEIFFWKDLADNYLEMSKKRLYEDASKGHEGAKHTLYRVLLATIKLFAPFMPYVTEEIYQGIFKALEGSDSIHKSAWPVADESLINDADEAAGVQLVEVATAIRRYKTEHNLPLGTELNRLQLATGELAMAKVLQESEADIVSVTRAKKVEVTESLDPGLEAVKADGAVTVALGR